MLLSASLVLYRNPVEIYGRAIESFLCSSDDAILFVVDNSPVPLHSEYWDHPRVKYIFSNGNVGFGAGHNRAIRELAGQSKFHLLMNPDVEFRADVLPLLVDRMVRNENVGAVMPRILFPDGSEQRLCKLLPTPADLLLRRFTPGERLRTKINKRYELWNLGHDKPFDVPNLSGCFLLIRTEVLQKVGGFDERYFMYMEDVDLVRRIGNMGRTVFEPEVFVTHHYGKGSYRNKTLLLYHINSAIAYFNKWGWFFDPVRRMRNRATLESIK